MIIFYLEIGGKQKVTIVVDITFTHIGRFHCQGDYSCVLSMILYPPENKATYTEKACRISQMGKVGESMLSPEILTFLFSLHKSTMLYLHT